MEDKSKVILIGGAPTVGKSHLARRLSEHLKMPWISTDAIREMMRKIIDNKEKYPYLFDNERSPEEYLTQHSVQEIIRNQCLESMDVWKGVQALIETDYVWKSFIVEGVAVLPELVHSSFKDNKSIKSIFLVNENRERIRHVVFTRGLWDDADKYPDSVKEKEVEWAYEFSRWLRKEAEKYSYPVYEISDVNFLMEQILNLLNLD